jgi:hypothetical protein
MLAPKSIVLVHRRNQEYLNKKLVPYMRDKYSTQFIILYADENFLEKEWVNQKDITIDMNDLAGKAQLGNTSEKEIFEEARSFENKYNITYVRDSFMQNRNYALKFLDVSPNNPITYGKKPDLKKITEEQNYYFNYFEKCISKYAVDLVIARPDNSMGFALNNIAEKLKIPSTIQIPTRVKGYYFWPCGAYLNGEQLRIASKKIKYKPEILPNNDNKKWDNSFKVRDKQIRSLSFKATINEIVFNLKDRINWLIKDIKRGKLGKRVPFIPKIIYILKRHIDHRYFQRVFVSDMKIINSKPYIYFPLPMEPEYNTHSLSKEFINVHAMAQQAAICLPSGYNLVIKEHTPNIGFKRRQFYKSLIKLPNVLMANYMLSGPELVNTAEAVMTISGTSGLEAAERGKMAIIFGSSEYIHLSNILLGHSMRDLPEIIKKALAPLSKDQKNKIIEEFKLLKQIYKDCGYYAPDSPFFLGNSENIMEKELVKAVDNLIDVWNIQKNILKK